MRLVPFMLLGSLASVLLAGCDAGSGDVSDEARAKLEVVDESALAAEPEPEVDLQSAKIAASQEPDVCAHIIALLRLDLAGDVTKETVEEVEAKCLEGLATEKQTLPAAEFERKVACVLAAKRMNELTACEPDR